MKAKTKAQRERRKALESSYKTFHDCLKCYYCGQVSDTVDHVPAISVAYEIGMDEIERRDTKLHKVSACRECNCILGNKPILTLEDRARYIYERLQKRYRRINENQNYTVRVEPFEDTLSGRRQADAIENYLFHSKVSASSWCNNLWDESQSEVFEGDYCSQRQYRLDRIKYCLEQLDEQRQ